MASITNSTNRTLCENETITTISVCRDGFDACELPIINITNVTVEAAPVCDCDSVCSGRMFDAFCQDANFYCERANRNDTCCYEDCVAGCMGRNNNTDKDTVCLSENITVIAVCRAIGYDNCNFSLATIAPTQSPTNSTRAPTFPTTSPSNSPTTVAPTAPTGSPTTSPSRIPSASPTMRPTGYPTPSPTNTTERDVGQLVNELFLGTVHLSGFLDCWIFIIIWTVVGVSMSFFFAGIKMCMVTENTCMWLYVPILFALLGALIGFVEGCVSTALISGLYSEIPYDLGLDNVAGLGLGQALVIVYSHLGRLNLGATRAFWVRNCT